MSDLIKCPTCRGAKLTMGLGGIKINCTECSAVGWVNGEAKNDEGISPSEIDQLRADLRKMIDAYEALQTENEELKAAIESLKNSAKQKPPKPPKPPKKNKKS